MTFWNIGEVKSLEPMTKKEFLRCLWCKMVVLLKHEDGTPGQEELLPQAREGWLIIYLGVGKGLGIAYSLRSLEARFPGPIVGKRSFITV